MAIDHPIGWQVTVSLERVSSKNPGKETSLGDHWGRKERQMLEAIIKNVSGTCSLGSNWDAYRRSRFPCRIRVLSKLGLKPLLRFGLWCNISLQETGTASSTLKIKRSIHRFVTEFEIAIHWQSIIHGLE